MKAQAPLIRAATFRRLATALAGLVLLGQHLVAGGPETKIKLGTLLPRGTSYHQLLQEMSDGWSRASEGRVRLVIYPDQSMGGEADMVRKMRIGQLDAGLLSAVGLSEIDPAVKALQSLPMMFRSLDEVDYVGEKLRTELERLLLQKGFRTLFWADAGWVRFFSKTPVQTPAAWKKLKIWVWSGDTHQVDIMKAAGYNPVPLETADVLPGLHTGLIDAAPFIPFVALTGQIYGPASHMLEINWAPLVGAAVVRETAWNRLPPEARETCLSVAAEVGIRMRRKSREESVRSVETMRKKGLTVHPMTPELEAEWRRAVEPIYSKIRGRIVPAAFFDHVLRLLQEYRQSRPGSAGADRSR
jgi:TRAP-type C4-dicarboxylate transport system substrate-binding protein